MIRITTYCIEPLFLDILIRSLVGLPATVTIRHNANDILECLSTDIYFINDTPGGIDLLNSIRQSDSVTPVVFIDNELEDEWKVTTAIESAINIVIKGNASVTDLLPKLQNLIDACYVSRKSSEIRFRNSVFNYVNCELVFEDRREQMSKKEAAMLRTFYLNRNDIMLKDDIVRLVWGRSDRSAKNSFGVYLCNLKKIIKKEESIAIRTVRGLGYIFYMDHV